MHVVQRLGRRIRNCLSFPYSSLSTGTSVSCPSTVMMIGESGLLSWNPLTSFFGTGSSFHVFSVTTRRTICDETPKDLASKRRKCELGAIAYAARISRTSFQVNWCKCCFSPLALLPLATISLESISALPRNKWSGRTQQGVSQQWQTHLISGIGPLKATYETRCANIRSPSISISPYPPLFSASIHNQQPEFGSGIESSLIRFCSGVSKGRLSLARY